MVSFLKAKFEVEKWSNPPVCFPRMFDDDDVYLITVIICPFCV
jgi:hypothetical protein